MKKERLLKILSGQFLTIATLASVVLGVTVGLILRVSASEKWSEREVMYLNFIGELFLRMLKGLILPLVISSLIDAIGSLDLRASGKIGARAITYYMITTVVAVILGIILVLTVRPGVDRHENANNNSSQQLTNSKLRSTTTTDTMLDLIRNMFPPNIIQACLEQYQTVLKPIDSTNPGELFTFSFVFTEYRFFFFLVSKKDHHLVLFTLKFFLCFLGDINDWSISSVYGNGMNIIGLVVAACVCGIAMSSMHEHVKTLLALVKEISQMMMKITGWVISISPIGIFFLTVSQILRMDDLNVVFGKLGLYLITVIGGITFHGFVILPAIFYAFTRQNPYVFIVRMGQALITAFGTGSR